MEMLIARSILFYVTLWFVLFWGDPDVFDILKAALTRALA